MYDKLYDPLTGNKRIGVFTSGSVYSSVQSDPRGVVEQRIADAENLLRFNPGRAYDLADELAETPIRTLTLDGRRRLNDVMQRVSVEVLHKRF